METVSDLAGPAPAPRRAGRPKGAKNRRGKEFAGLISAKYGASAGQQAAALCMVTPAELKAAGGSMAKAQVNKALDLVKHVRAAQGGRNDWLRALVREELADLADLLPDQVQDAVSKAVKRISEAAAGFGLKEALDMLTRERAQLLPYTDQRQPLAVDATVNGGAPSVVIMGAAPSIAAPMGLEKAEVFEGVYTEVSPAMSHGEGQGPEIPGLLPAPATD